MTFGGKSECEMDSWTLEGRGFAHVHGIPRATVSPLDSGAIISGLMRPK